MPPLFSCRQAAGYKGRPLGVVVRGNGHPQALKGITKNRHTDKPHGKVQSRQSAFIGCNPSSGNFGKYILFFQRSENE